MLKLNFTFHNPAPSKEIISFSNNHYNSSIKISKLVYCIYRENYINMKLILNTVKSQTRAMCESYKLHDFSVLCRLGFPNSFYFLHFLHISLFPFYLNSTFLLRCVLLSKVYHPLLVFFLRHPIFLKRIKSHTYQGFCNWKAILTVEAAISSLISIILFGGLISFEDKTGTISYSFDI